MLLGTCVIIWGFNFTVIKYSLGHGFTPLAFGSARFAIATAAFAGITLSRRESPRVSRRDLLVIMAWSAAIVVNQIGFVYSFRFARASTVALLFGTLPIFAGIYSQLWGIERLNSGAGRPRPSRSRASASSPSESTADPPGQPAAS